MPDDLRAHLTNEVHRVDWKPLAPHAKRGALVLVDSALDLVDVALAVAQDDSERVQQWLNARQILKPTEDQIDAWTGQTEERFTVIIVQPYVLAQRDTGPPLN
jgi:hypothetical protein